MFSERLNRNIEKFDDIVDKNSVDRIIGINSQLADPVYTFQNYAETFVEDIQMEFLREMSAQKTISKLLQTPSGYCPGASIIDRMLVWSETKEPQLWSTIHSILLSKDYDLKKIKPVEIIEEDGDY